VNTRAELNLRSRPRRLLAGLLAVLTLAAVFTVAPARPAQAVSCYGDYCSGKDPQASGCSADARMVAVEGVYGTGGESWVELRWSPTCKTNWARVNFAATSVKAVQSTGYTQTYSGTNGSYWWSAMIYSPTLCVKAVVSGGWGVTQTACY
jgi:hypothetical protein